MPIDDPGLSYYEIILDGEDATGAANASYSSLDYPSFELAGKLLLTDIAYLKVLEVMIPFSYYTINSVNNTFTLSDTSGVYTVTIAPGTYDPTTIGAELTLKLNASGTGFTYSVTYISSDLTLEIVNNAGVSNPFTITFSTGRDTLGKVVGFGEGAQASQTFDAPTGGNKLKGSVTQLRGSNYLYLNSSTIGTNVDLFLPRGSLRFGNGGPQIAAIPRLSDTFGDPLHYDDPASTKWFDMHNFKTLTAMDLFVSDGPNGSILQFNGKSFMVKLGVLLWDTSVTQADNVKVKKLKTKRMQATMLK
tara:strand:+ start:2112 stop:3023 length:912 start_codon:yes stop_codon:yes gene_type:complete